MRLLPLLALSLVTVSGCKAVDAMDNTETMKTDLAAMKQTTGGMAGTTNALDGNMLELKRLATIADGKAELVKDENTRSYAPPSINLVVGAKEIAENMHSDELIQFLDGKLKEVREMTPKDSEFKTNLLGNYSPAYVGAFNLSQQVRIIALQAVAGQIPQAMVEQLINEQIYGGGGRYVDTMYTVLMLRAMFIDSFFLDKGVFNTATPWSTVGEARDAREKVSQLDFVASLPFADRIGFHTTGTMFLKVVTPASLHAVPDAGMQVPVQTFPTLPDDASDEDKAAQAAAKQAYQAALDLQASKDAAQTEYESKCLHPANGKKDNACYATLGDAPSYDVSLDPSMAKHWWRKIQHNIALIPDSVRGSSSPYARELSEIQEEAKRRAAQ